MLDFLLSSDSFYVVLTMVAYSAGVAIQKKWKLAILNPILIGAALVILVLSLLGISNSTYQKGCTILNSIRWCSRTVHRHRRMRIQDSRW